MNHPKVFKATGRRPSFRKRFFSWPQKKKGARRVGGSVNPCRASSFYTISSLHHPCEPIKTSQIESSRNFPLQTRGSYYIEKQTFFMERVQCTSKSLNPFVGVTCSCTIGYISFVFFVFSHFFRQPAEPLSYKILLEVGKIHF